MTGPRCQGSHDRLVERCLDCKAEIYYCEMYHDYFHVDAPPCFLIQGPHP